MFTGIVLLAAACSPTASGPPPERPSAEEYAGWAAATDAFFESPGGTLWETISAFYLCLVLFQEVYPLLGKRLCV